MDNAPKTETAQLNQKVTDLYHHFEKNLSPFLCNGDVPTSIRSRVEIVHDMIAELFLVTSTGKEPVVKVIEEPMIIPESTHGNQHATVN